MSFQKKNRNVGAALLFVIFGLLFFVLAVRFVTIQYTGEVKGKALAAKAENLYKRSEVLEARRGTIYDHYGEVIAEDSASYTMVAILDKSLTVDSKRPRHVVDPEKTAKELAALIPMEEQEIYKLLTAEDRKQVEFGEAGRDLSHRVKKEIENLALPGITFIKETKRFYPNGIFASHLIGYAQREQKDGKPTEIVGRTGLEKSYDQLLKGKDGYLEYQGDVWNYILPNSKEQVKEPQNGSDIYLTIDKKIQTFLEDALNKVNEKYSPSRVLVTVADPKTGAILAMGQRPTFHPVTREGINETWHNEVVESSFEPGSTMKVFSLAAAVQEGAFHPNATYPSGKYFYNKKQLPIKDHNQGQGWGSISYLEGVQRSSNVAFAYMLEEMGTQTWRQYMDRFKFGQKTGISLPNEASGRILYDYPVEKVTSVFGQGTTVTPMQMIQAATAIANDGKMMKPYVVDKVVDPNTGKEKKTEPEASGNPVSAKSAKKVRDILETVITSEHGTGKGYYDIDGYTVAGKTGTAQIAAPNGGYLQGKENYIFSFLGMAPKDDPKLVMYVVVEKPKLKADENGALPVSQIFKPVMKSSLQYLNIEPEQKEKSEIIELPDLKGSSTEKAVTELKSKGLQPILMGSGNQIKGQSPANSQSVIEGEKIILKTNGELTVPDMTGWSKRDVLKVAQLGDLGINMVGNGYAIKQNIKPSTKVKSGDKLIVNFESQQQILDSKKKKKEKPADEAAPLD